MTLINFFVGLYLFCGLITLIYVWNKDYKDQYTEAKNLGDVDDGMACLLMLYIFFFWPIFLVYRYIKKKFIGDIF